MSFLESFKRFCRIIADKEKIAPNAPPPVVPQKPSVPSLSSSAKQTIEMTLEKIKFLSNVINTTTDPAEFFKDLNMTLDFLLRLFPFEKYGIFTSGSPSNDYRKIVSNLYFTVSSFIKRTVAQNQEALEGLSPDEYVKQKSVFLSNLKYSFDNSHLFWTGDPGFPHYSDSLYSEANYHIIEDLWSRFRIEAHDLLLPGPFDFSAHDPIDIDENEYPVLQSKNFLFLRDRGLEYELSGKTDLAILCLKKSSALLRKIKRYDVNEYLPLVEILARAGLIEEARREKEFIDKLKAYNNELSEKRSVLSLELDCSYYNTDLIIMSVNNRACSECAKYQGRVFSRTGKDLYFPKLPDELRNRAHLHPGCTHFFRAYIPGISSSDLETTLYFHPLSNPDYGKNIVTFSNRPFIDDRTEEAKIEAESVTYRINELKEREDNYYTHVIEIEANRGQEIRDFSWIQENIPDKCPKSITGYRRMKTMNTKNYQLLKELAAQKGREIL